MISSKRLKLKKCRKYIGKKVQRQYQKTVLLLPWNCEFWFEVTGNKIWSNFRFIYSLFRENIETKFAGKKESFKTLLLYFVSFSVILSFLSVSLKVRRVKRFFKMFFSKIFPVSLHFDVFCAFCCIFVVFTWTPLTRPLGSWSSRQAKR